MQIAVLMSSYNGERFIREQIDSILAQEGCEVELIVRDDGSTDRTTDILKEYEQQGKIKWYSGQNLRSMQSFFHLLKNCGVYDFYAYADQDDIWDSDKLITGIGAIQDSKKMACYFCSHRIIDKDGNVVWEPENRGGKAEIVQRTNFAHTICAAGAQGCTMVLNRKLVEALQKKGLPKKAIMHDAFIQTACASMGGELFWDANAHLSYRQHEGNVMGRKLGKWNGLMYRINYLMERHEVSIEDHAKSILELYPEYIAPEHLKMLHMVADYKKNLRSRFSLAFSSELKTTAFIRISLLLGKR